MGAVCCPANNTGNDVLEPPSSTRSDAYKKFLSFKDFKGFKKVDDITSRH